MSLAFLPVMPSHLLILILTVICASLLPCLVCFDTQYEYCQNTGSACGTMNITYPFGVGNRGCGLPGTFQVDCVQSSSPVIQIDGRNYTIVSIYYDANTLVIFMDERCKFLGDSINIGLDDANPWFRTRSTTNWTLNVFKCSKPIKDTQAGQIKQCNASVYYSLSLFNYSVPGCVLQQAPVETARMEWVSNDTVRDESCTSCEASGGICGYNISDSTAASPFVCYCRDRPYTDKCPSHGRGNKSTIIGLSIGGAALAAIAVICLVFYAKKRRTQPTGTSDSKVEKFLRDYAYEMPTRYSHDQLKKMTNNFTEKLGEGGFGVVYKGMFRNGTLVAVKVLDRQRHSEAQFMNEVATIGRVHHVNLVRLLGFCFESPISALVYEFMANGSLEKLIFTGKEKGRMLKWEQLYSIALGTAHGIAYLHQGCEKRIIHFDIKPHNILLDTDFTPKVCDFGLAKLSGKEDDHISMTAGRGTPGYVAPEVCDSALGPVTDKSDVYSFGMVLLEMVGGRKNINWKASCSSQFYFPEWAFKLLETGKLGRILRGAGGQGEIEAEAGDEEKARKLTKVGLWCIQYKSTDRPSMSRIVQILEGNGDDMPNPPLPFNIFSPATETSASMSSRNEEFSSMNITSITETSLSSKNEKYTSMNIISV